MLSCLIHNSIVNTIRNPGVWIPAWWEESLKTLIIYGNRNNTSRLGSFLEKKTNPVRNKINPLITLCYVKSGFRRFDTTKITTDTFQVVLQLVNKFQQTCQFHHVANKRTQDADSLQILLKISVQNIRWQLATVMSSTNYDQYYGTISM